MRRNPPFTARFLVFGGNAYYPIGGARDLLGQADTLAEAQALGNHLADPESLDWFHVLDRETGNVSAWTRDEQTL